jgi:uncharacterized membrane protein
MAFRLIMTLMVFLIFAAISLWRKEVNRQNFDLNALNTTIQDQIIQLSSGKMLSEVEKARVSIKLSKHGNYISGGAPELMDRLLKKR